MMKSPSKSLELLREINETDMYWIINARDFLKGEKNVFSKSCLSCSYRWIPMKREWMTPLFAKILRWGREIERRGRKGSLGAPFIIVLPPQTPAFPSPSTYF